MAEFEFTPPQWELIRTTQPTYVEACPGAGKTQTIVQRFINRPLSHPRKGVGLLSFTNAAIDEALCRSAFKPELRKVPNFIGTIDSFINRFLVGPIFLARKGISARFTDTWSSFPHTQVSVRGVRWKASLDWFAIDGDSARLEVDWAPGSQRRLAANLDSREIQSLQERALTLWSSLLRRGILSSSASRIALRQYLSDDGVRKTLGELMGDRFIEIIVDEAQDCTADDVMVLKFLHDFGVNVVAVGDPEQSIYAFRSQVPAAPASALEFFNRGARLNQNFRSTPAICSVLDSLRSSNSIDEAAGPNKTDETPVVLVRFRRRPELREKFVSILEKYQIASEHLVVLAHSAAHARDAAGAPIRDVDGTNRLVRLADALYVINDATRASPDRVAAVRVVERAIRELGTAEVAEFDHEQYLQVCGISDRMFRAECLRIATSTPNPFGGTPTEFRASLAAMTSSQAVLLWNVRKLRSPKDDTWPNGRRTGDLSTSFRYSTIHGFKGHQSAAVALVIPESRHSDDGVQQWRDGRAGEDRRVLYVGASRAQSLLILAAHESVWDTVTDQLKMGGVPFTAISGEVREA